MRSGLRLARAICPSVRAPQLQVRNQTISDPASQHHYRVQARGGANPTQERQAHAAPSDSWRAQAQNQQPGRRLGSRAVDRSSVASRSANVRLHAEQGSFAALGAAIEAKTVFILRKGHHSNRVNLPKPQWQVHPGNQ